MNVPISSANQLITSYQKLYSALVPDHDSFNLTKELWIEWEKSGIKPPNIEEIAQQHAKFELGFFYDLVAVAERLGNSKLAIHYCAFCLDSYNFYAVSADDGYIVLIDESFFQLLFFLIHLFIFQAQGLIEETEYETVQRLVGEVIANNYFHRKQFDFSQESIFSVLLKRDYELTEFAGYFFHAVKAFIIAHEIGHHVLGHTVGKVTRQFGSKALGQSIVVDERKIAVEYEADAYGYRLFQALNSTIDGSITYAYCHYRFDFAPLFLFDLFACLDQVSHSYEKKVITYPTHPAPEQRFAAIQQAFNLPIDDPLYCSLKESLDLIAWEQLGSFLPTR